MTRIAPLTLAALLAATAAHAQATPGDQAAELPVFENMPEGETKDVEAIQERLGEGNYTFADDFPVASKVVRGSQTGMEPTDGMLDLDRPAIVLDGWTDVTETASLDALVADQIALWSERGEEIGEIEEWWDRDAGEVVVSLGGMMGLFEDETTLRAAALTLMQAPDGETRAYVAASQEMLERQPEVNNGNALVPVRDADAE